MNKKLEELMNKKREKGIVISLIWSQSLNGVTHYEGEVPWHVPEHNSFISQMTANDISVMDSETYTSLPQYRKDDSLIDVVVGDSQLNNKNGFNDLIEWLISQNDSKRIWIVGGKEVFDAFLDIADHLFTTEVDVKVPFGKKSTEGPHFDPKEFTSQTYSDWVVSTGHSKGFPGSMKGYNSSGDAVFYRFCTVSKPDAATTAIDIIYNKM